LVITRIILICTRRGDAGRLRTGVLTVAAILGGIGLTGCGGSPSGESASRDGAERLDVVAGFYPLAFAASEIGGEGVSVSNLTPPGAEPHDLELSPRDVERVRSADLVLYLGGGFQPALGDAIGETEGRAVDALAGLELSGEDPHVWLDPLRYERIAARIGEALGRPEAARAFSERLAALDVEYEAGLRGCERREIVTSHAAFGYLAERYGLEQIAITGLEPEAEPAPRELERRADLARELGATTSVCETLGSPELAEAVAREIGAETATLDPLEGLTGEEAEGGEDYFSLMRRNLAVLREALGCR
jgi:zinc transport system substrate-binding protein